ncbi:cupin domain-containing protein [Phenylobacterium sp. LjRoot225]|uniref:cupin domain-containing protein n=1 Tax=Phenylobacterium sp. LjRoot225 TaxID=3342285 RepID=UPI003ECF5229
MLRTAVLMSGLLCLSSPVAAQVNSADLKWGPAPAVFPAGAQMAVLSGDPHKAGVFVVRLKVPAGYKVPAHHHPTDEYVTVISGDLSLGMGDKLDPAKAAKLAAGGFAVAGAKMNHFAFSTEGAVVQVSAEGPFGMTYVNPADDPTRQ